MDLAKVFRDSQTGDNHELEELEGKLEYTTGEKAKSFVWNGAIKGEVYDSYSGLGAISADLCILGDVRDLGIQSWKYVTDSKSLLKMLPDNVHVWEREGGGVYGLHPGTQSEVILYPQESRVGVGSSHDESYRAGFRAHSGHRG